jgi:predicted MFS family arabinose efflux permease
LNFVVAVRRLPESLPGPRRGNTRFHHPLTLAALRDATAVPGAATLLAIFFLTTVGFAVLEGTFSLAATHRFGHSAAEVDLLWLYMGLVAVVVQGWLVGRLARRVPERLLVVAGTASLAVGLGWIPFAAWPGGLLVALGLVVAGQGLASPSLASLISKTTTTSRHGVALGVAQALSAGARVLGPAGGGLLFGRLGVESPYVVAAVCAAGALGLALPTAFVSDRTDDVVPLRRSS